MEIRFVRPWSVFVLGAVTSSILAEEPKVDADLPQPFDGAVAQEMLANSPFTRPLNLSHSLRLTGIAYVEGHPVGTFLNKETKESFILSEAPNAMGWRLAETTPGTALERTHVKIFVLGELVTVGYGDEQIDPGPTKRGSVMARSEKSGRSGGYGPPGGGKDPKVMSEKGREKIMEVLAKKHPDYSQEQLAALAQKIGSKSQGAEPRDPGQMGTKSSRSSRSRSSRGQ